MFRRARPRSSRAWPAPAPISAQSACSSRTGPSLIRESCRLPIDSRIEKSSPLLETSGRYEVVTNLGQGGMADVLLAVRRGAYASNKLVVIKKLRVAPGDDQELVNMFVDEARIAMRLSHPNVVSTFDFVAQGEELYLTMEFL